MTIRLALLNQTGGASTLKRMNEELFEVQTAPACRLAVCPIGENGGANSVRHHVEDCGLGAGGPTVRLAHMYGAQGDGALQGTNGFQVAESQAPALLVSYFYLDPFLKNQHRYRYRDWVMDSGAFSAHNSGQKIDLNRYVDKCLELLASDRTLTEVFALDVIGNAEASLKNCEEMWRQGVPAIPCFHQGEPEEFLFQMAKEYPKIALGGVALERGDFKLAWLEQCFARVWPKKIHGFGMSSEAIVYGLPFHSVDATNWEIAPCLAGDSLVSTPQGLVRIDALAATQEQFSVNTYEQVIVNNCYAVFKGFKETITVKVNTGQAVICTVDHKILTAKGWVEAGNLKIGDKVKIVDKQLRTPVMQESLLDELFGWMTGDGWCCIKNNRHSVGVLFADGGDDEAREKLVPVWDQFTGGTTKLRKNKLKVNNPNNKTCIWTKCSEQDEVWEKFLSYGFKPGIAINRELPTYILKAPPERQQAFLRGLFSADGSVGRYPNGNYQMVQLASNSRTLLHQVQVMLLDYGVQTHSNWMKPWMKNEQGQLYICGNAAKRFMDIIGFNLTAKNNKFKVTGKWCRQPKQFGIVKSITPAGEAKTFDVIMPSVHHFVANGIIVHNCAFGNWQKFGAMSVRGSNQDLRSQVKHYLDMEAKARVRWSREMLDLEKLAPSPKVLGAPSIRLVANANANAGREDTKAQAFGGTASSASRTAGAVALDAGAAGGNRQPAAIGAAVAKAAPEPPKKKLTSADLDAGKNFKYADYWTKRLGR